MSNKQSCTTVEVVETTISKPISMDTQLYYTKSYDVFNTLNGNRLGSSKDLENGGYYINGELVPFTKSAKTRFKSRVKAIAKSMIDFGGYNKDLPVIVAQIDEQLYIIDGQGRAEAARQTGYPIYFRQTLNDVNTLEEARVLAFQMNQCGSVWMADEKLTNVLMDNDINSLEVLKNRMVFMKEYPFIKSPALMLQLMGGQGANKMGCWNTKEDCKKMIKSIEKDFPIFIKTMSLLNECYLQATPVLKKLFSGEKFPNAVRTVVNSKCFTDEYGARFVKNFNSNMTYKNRISEYVKCIEECINYNKKKDIFRVK